MKKEFLGAVTGGVAVCALAAWANRRQFSASLLFAFVLWLNVSLGAMAQLMMHHLTGGRWGFVVRRILEAALAPLPALAVVFAFVFAETPQLRNGTGYFAPRLVIARAIVIFGVWIWMACSLRRWSLKQDAAAADDFNYARRLRTLSGPGLVLYFVTLSFAVVDWLMALQPHWRSTMFPVTVISTQALMGLSTATVAAVCLLPFRKEPVKQLASTDAWHELGKLLFAFVIFWTYVCFGQLLIIWSGNLPLESSWYLQRSRNGWQWLARAIAMVCFFAPAAVLLFQAPKKNRRTMAFAAAGIWVSQAIYVFWTIAPAFFPAFHVDWMDLGVPLAIGAVWGAFFWRAWSTAAPIPENDPRFEELGVSTS